MSDEVARLRVDLEAGRWERLLDPLLPLLLLADPGLWWPEAVRAVLESLQRQGEARIPAWARSLPEALAWNRVWEQQTRLGRPLVDPRSGRSVELEANVAWARAVVRVRREHGQDVEAMTRAIDVLEGWIWPTSSGG